MKSILLVKKFFGLVQMTSGLVNASFSLPEWQAVKMIFFAPCTYKSLMSITSVVITVGHLSLFTTLGMPLVTYCPARKDDRW